MIRRIEQALCWVATFLEDVALWSACLRGRRTLRLPARPVQVWRNIRG